MSKVLNVTNGDCFNRYFSDKFKEKSVPFCESMMDGDAAGDIYSEEFIKLRSLALGVSQKEYTAKMHLKAALCEEPHEIRLWFGKDTFCQLNLLTLLAYLEQTRFPGRVSLNYIDDESFETLERDIKVSLGIYKKLYQDVLILKNPPTELGVLVAESLELYFDYHSDSGKLACLVRENADKDDLTLICLLLKNSHKYGLSDIQAQGLIKKYKR